METKPSFSEFRLMARQGNLIPVYQEFLADTETPVSAYLKIKDKSFSYLLESADGGKKWGRYSFIGYKPYLIALSRDREMEISIGKEKRTLKDVENPLQVLRDIIKDIKPVTLKPGRPPTFPHLWPLIFTPPFMSLSRDEEDKRSVHSSVYLPSRAKI